jgi:hypothetical protein
MRLKGYDNSPVVQQFTAAMAHRGLLPPKKFIADGKLHRCSTKAKNGRGDGSYLLHLDGTIPAGARTGKMVKAGRTGTSILAAR